MTARRLVGMNRFELVVIHMFADECSQLCRHAGKIISECRI
jgi:predicted HD phosphohydrolase